MVSLTSLWLPIVLSAVFVFVVSSVIHMLLPYHQNDFDKLPAEDDVMDALRRFNIPPGDYVMPRPANAKERATPEFTAKMNKGPIAFMTVYPSGPPSMGQSLVLWFLLSIVVSIFAGYLASRAVPAGGDYLAVFRFAGATAFAGYGLALLQNSIWYKRKWSTTFKSVFDSLIYALVTAGTFGWLWPA